MTQKLIELGTLFGLRLTAKPSVLGGTALVWALGMAVTALVFGVGWGGALIVGLGVAIVHWLSEFTHQLGHAWAARRVGQPMIGIRFWGLLSTSIYPRDEGDLPAGVHIRRALGGPFFSLLLSLIGGLLLILAPAPAPAWRSLLWFFFLENFVILTLQVFVPLGFNDGGTLWHWLRRR
jgi:hypothetical protein